MSNPELPKLLPDTPGEKDEFGGHEQIAKGIVELIHRQEGGKNISLVGSWGSGKSTVIRFLKKELEKPHSIKASLFVFDTWTSQTDPLRFSFLEQLVAFLEPDKGSPIRQECDQQLERFRFKVTHQKITNRPRIEAASQLILFLLLLWPIALEDKDIVSNPPIYFGLINLGLLSAPFVVAILVAGWWLLTGDFRTKSLLSLFFQSELSIDQDTESRSYELTATEFQEFFDKLLEHYFSKNNKKLVVVLDNIDRVDRAHSSAVWTALKAITETFQKGDANWRKNTWLIVPYDKDTITLPFEGSPTVNINSQPISEVFDTNAFSIQVARAEMRSDYLEKTFQLEYSVPPPILSLKKEYFDTQLRAAINVSDANLEFIYQTFQFSNGNRNVTTPRKIKKFINDLVASLHIWGEKFDIRVLALYNALRPSISDPFIELLNQNLIPPNLEMALSRENYRTELAALFFGADLKRANEILFAQTISQAITKCDSEALKTYFAMQGFDTSFGSYVGEQAPSWPDVDPGLTLNTAYLLKSMPNETASRILLGVRESMASVFGKAKKWSALTRKQFEGAIYLAEKTNLKKHELSDFTAKLFAANYSEYSDANAIVALSKDRAEGIAAYLSWLDEEGRNSALEKVDLPSDYPILIDLAGLISSKTRSDAAEKCHWKQTLDTVITKTTEVILMRQIPNGVDTLAELIIKGLSEQQSDSILTAVEKRFANQEQMPEETILSINSIMDTFSKYRESAKTSDLKARIVRNGWLLHHFADVQKSSTIRQIVIQNIINVGTPPSSITAFGRSNEAIQILNSFSQNASIDELNGIAVRLIGALNDKEKLIELSKNEALRYWQRLHSIVVSEIIQKLKIEDAQGVFIDQLLPIVDKYHNTDMIPVIRKSLETTHVDELIFSKHIDSLRPQQASTLLEAAVNLSLRQRNLSIIFEYFKDLGGEFWNKEVVEKKWLSIFIEANESLHTGFGTNLKAALFKLILSDGKFANEQSAADIVMWSELLTSSYQATLWRDAMDLWAGFSSQDKLQFFRFFGQALQKHKIVGERADEILRKGVIPIFETRDESLMAGWQEILRQYVVILEEAHEETRETLQELQTPTVIKQEPQEQKSE